MRKILSVALIGCFLLGSVPPGIAAPNASRSRCNIAQMLKSSADDQWLRVDCLREVTAYLNRNSNINKDSVVLVNAQHRIFGHIRSLVRQRKVKEAEDLRKAYGAFLKSRGPIDRTVCLDSKGNIVPCPFAKIQEEVSLQLNGLGHAPNAEADAEASVGLYFGSGKNNSELNDIVTRLAQMNKQQLGSAIGIMAAAGSGNSTDPDYVHPLVFEAAFLFYARKLDRSEKLNIAYYLQAPSASVQWAAANALSAYAAGNQNPIGKFSLTPGDKRQITDLFIESVLLLPQPERANSLIYRQAVARLGNLYRDPVADSGLAAALSAPQRKDDSLAAAVGVLAVPLKAGGEAAAAGASAGTAVIITAGIAFFLYALNEAYSPGYEAVFSRAKERFWDDVFFQDTAAAAETFPADDILEEDGVVDLIVVWTPDMVRLGGLSATAAASKTKKKPTCEYRSSPAASDWKLNKLHEYVNNGDPRSIAKLTELRGCLGRYNFCPADVKDERRPFAGCAAVRLKDMEGVSCASRDIQQLIRVNEVASSFYALGTGQKLFTRAIYRENIAFSGGVQIGVPGRWIPEAEIGIRFNDVLDEAPKIFVQEIKDIIDRQLQGFLGNIQNIFSLGNYRSFRLGDHERSSKYRWNEQEQKFDKKQTDKPYQHFHYEEYSAYPAKNPYICNHSIYYQLPVN